MKWWKKAFAVDPEGPSEPTDQQRELVDRLCQEVVRRRMTSPALMALEMFQPMNYLGSQAMHFFAPIATAIFDANDYNQFATFLERRGSVEYLCRKIEELEEKAEKTEGDETKTEESTNAVDEKE